MAYIGLDIGTSSVKGILLSQQREVLLTVTKTYPINYFNDNWSEQNPDDWYEKTLEVLEQLTKEEKNINGISFSGQMHGLVMLDEEDKVIRPAILWNDQRTLEECNYLNEQVGKQVLREEVANIALTGYTLPKILWVKKHEKENYAKIAKIMLPKDYVCYKLSGVFASDVSDLSGTLLFDVKNKKYSKKMLDIAGLEEKNLPKIFESYDVVGILKKDYKEKLKLKNDVDIIIGGGDQAVGAIGTATVQKDDINISLGTSGVVYVSCDDFILPQNEIVHSFCDATGSYLLMGVALCTGGSISWFWDTVLKRQEYGEIVQHLKKATCDEMYFLPYISGERSPINDSKAKGAFLGLTHQTDDYAMLRCIIEGTSFSLNHILNSLEISDLSNIKITGGGSKNELWVQTIADVFKANITTIKSNEGPALGAAILAMAGHEKIDVKKIAKQIVQKNENFEPINDFSDKYNKWLTIYPKIKQLNL